MDGVVSSQQVMRNRPRNPIYRGGGIGARVHAWGEPRGQAILKTVSKMVVAIDEKACRH